MVAFVALLGIIGFVHMCKNNCHLKKNIGATALQIWKKNEDYGDYYYSDGDRRLDVMEV